MFEDIAVMIQQFGASYPIVRYVAGYVLLTFFGILIIALAYLTKDYLGISLGWFFDRLVAVVIMLCLIGWAATCVLFVFPFHCFKNRKMLMDITRDKLRNK